jgi:hypothetical protein
MFPDFSYAMCFRTDSQQRTLQEESVTTRPALIPTLSSSASIQREIEKTQEKAAHLRARILEKQTSSKGPIADGQARISEPPPQIRTTATAPVEAIAETNKAVDNLVQEAREAAALESQAQQQSMSGWMNPDRARQLQPAAGKADGNDLADHALQVWESAIGPPSKKYSKTAKVFKSSRTLDNRKAKKEQQAANGANIIENKKNGISGKPSALTKQFATSGTASNRKGNNIVSSQHLKANSEGEGTNTTDVELPKQNPSRSDTLLSTSTIKPDGNNGNNSPIEQDVLHKKISLNMNKTSTKDEVSSTTEALAAIEGSPPDNRVLPIADGTDLALLNARDQPPTSLANYSHHFDDLDEWLEMTGYHDRGNREKVLGLYRRRAELESQMAEVERELEQSTVQRNRSLRAPTSNGLPKSRAPTLTRAVSGTNIASLSSVTDGSKPTMVKASNGGTKRTFSPERGPASIGAAHIVKQRRLSPSVKDTRRSEIKTAEPPTGPR